MLQAAALLWEERELVRRADCEVQTVRILTLFSEILMEETCKLEWLDLRTAAKGAREREHETRWPQTSSMAMSLLRGLSALRLSAPTTTTTTCLCRALSSSARPAPLRPSPLLSLASRPSLTFTPTLPAQQSSLGSVRTFKMPKGAKKSKKSPLSRGTAKTARKHGKRAVSS